MNFKRYTYKDNSWVIINVIPPDKLMPFYHKNANIGHGDWAKVVCASTTKYKNTGKTYFFSSSIATDIITLDIEEVLEEHFTELL